MSNEPLLTFDLRHLSDYISANEAYVKEHYPDDIFISDFSEIKGINKYVKGLVIPENVKVAEFRIPFNSDQREILRKELRQAEILTNQGCSVYLIPERAAYGLRPKDAVVNGLLFEFRTVTGNARTMEGEFRDAKKKGVDVNVFIHIESNICYNEAKRRIKLAINDHPEYKGLIILSLLSEEKLYIWDTDKFR